MTTTMRQDVPTRQRLRNRVGRRLGLGLVVATTAAVVGFGVQADGTDARVRSWATAPAPGVEAVVLDEGATIEAEGAIVFD